MEQHPVPRNISSFQFHLVGDMTLRQFGYVAGGALIAFLIYKISPFPPFITFSLAGICGFVGFAFAFLPIQERPLDKWIVAFIKSIYSPTQYLWQKENIPPYILLSPAVVHTTPSERVHLEARKDVQDKLHAYLASLPIPLHQSINTQEKNYIDKTLALFGTSPVVVTSSQPPHIPTSPVPSLQPQPIKKVTPLPTLPIETPQKQILQSIQTPHPAEAATDLQKQLEELLRQKETLSNELAKLRQETQQETPIVIKPVVENKKEPTIKTITPAAAINEVGMPTLPQTPNMVIGVIKDSQKRILPNIIITIKDKNTLPLRALKTNKLGQFTVATPLPNGTYYLEFEDPLKRYTFDIAEISLSGKIFFPIEITAKGERDIMREKLAKELFSNANVY